MTFIVIFIALLIERFFDWSHLRYWQWFNAFQGAVARRFAGKSSYLILAITILSLVLGVLALNLLLSNLLYGFAKLLFQLFVLLYCLGPQNLWADAFACASVLAQGDDQATAAKLKAAFGIADTNYSLQRQLLNGIFIESNKRVFAVVFWFVVFGPAGAVLYRAVAQSTSRARNSDVPIEMVKEARLIESLLDWLPVRIFTFIFALGGHFVSVLSHWRKKVGTAPEGNDVLLTECGAAALGIEDQSKLPSDGSIERSAVSLLDRVFVIVLVIIALVKLVV